MDLLFCVKYTNRKELRKDHCAGKFRRKKMGVLGNRPERHWLLAKNAMDMLLCREFV